MTRCLHILKMQTPHRVDTFDELTESRGRSVTEQICEERIQADRFLTTSTVLKTWQ